MDTNKKLQRFTPPFSEGLTEQEVSLRHEQGLKNITQEKITKTNRQIIQDNVCTLFNAYNLMIGISLAVVGAYANMVYLLIIVMNILIGITQEIHAKKMVENLSLIGGSKAVVIRNKKEQEILMEELVLDDISVLKMGSQICADSTVVHGEIEVNESLLTGEADPVLKRPGNQLLSGSFVVSGQCHAQVEHVGSDNFAAKLARGAKKHKKINSELLGSMRKVTKFTSYFIIPIGIILFLQAFFLRDDSILNSVVSSAAALLGMLPKGLVLLMSTSLVAGIIKLSKKKILVQDLHSIEALAHVDMLCLDKTGTITEGKMCVSNLYVADETQLPITAYQAICCFTGAMKDNNATFIALQEHFTSDFTYKPLHKISFSSQRKWSAVTFEDMGTIVLGAPEKILSQNTSILPTEAAKAQKSGKRILCLGYTPEQLSGEILPDVSLIAAIELADPIRDKAKETFDFFQHEGVEIKIISGDNPVTVSSIAKQAGLTNYKSYIDMSEVNSEEDIARAAEQYSIFGRVSPGQKSQLVKALQVSGHTVGMTGDGVNDVLALKEADCGIAMASGSDAARQVSQIVLLNSDFTALPEAVMEGRRAVNNITRFGGVFLIKTIYSILLSIFSIVTMTAFPFIPIQITLCDLVIEAYPSFLLMLEPDHKRIKGKFLPNVLSRALPFAVLILINIIIVLCIAPMLGISGAEAITVMYYVTGFASLLAVFKACQPLNKVRAFVSITALIGFYAAAFLFTGILHLTSLTIPALMLFIGLAILCIPVKSLLARLVEKVFSKIENHKDVQFIKTK